MEADLNTELLAAESLGYEPTLVPKAKPPAPRARVRCAHLCRSSSSRHRTLQLGPPYTAASVLTTVWMCGPENAGSGSGRSSRSRASV